MPTQNLAIFATNCPDVFRLFAILKLAICLHVHICFLSHAWFLLYYTIASIVLKIFVYGLLGRRTSSSSEAKGYLAVTTESAPSVRERSCGVVIRVGL